MRKNALISLLNNIKGNPDIVLWNGFVEDYHNIKPEIVKVTLVKYCKEYLKSLDEYYNKPEQSEEYYKRDVASRPWDFPNEFVGEQQFSEWYGKNKKTVYVLTGEIRGKSYMDRLGTMKY